MSILNEIYPSHLIDKRHISAKLSNADSQTLDGLENYIIKSKNAKIFFQIIWLIKLAWIMYLIG